MKLITLTSTLTVKGFTFTEKKEDATLKGKGTYITSKGTRFSSATLLVAKPTIVNSIPAPSKPRLGFKITCPEQDLQVAREKLVQMFKEHLIKAELNLVDLQLGLNTAIDTGTLIKEELNGKRKRRE